MQPMDEHIDDADDETVIVYGDASDKNPWEFSQLSEQHSQDPTTPQHQSENNLLDQKEEEDKSSVNFISGKRQRRSLARRNLRRPRGTTITRHRNTHDRNGSQEEEVDEFDSLRSMVNEWMPERAKKNLQERRSQYGEGKNQNENEDRKENLSEPHRTNYKRSTHEEKHPTNFPQNDTSSRIEGSITIPSLDHKQRLCSPPDFDIWLSDYDEDFETDHSSRKTQTTKTTNQSKVASKRKSNAFKRKPEISSSSLPSTESYLETRNRRVFSSSLNSRQEMNPQPSQSTNMETTKSIVGLRPTHWHRRTTRPAPKRNTSPKGKNVSQQLAKKSSLMAATRFSFHKKSNRTSKPSTDGCSSPKEDSGNNSATRKKTSCYLSPIETENRNDARSQRKRPSASEAPKSSFSFAPSFVAKKASALSQDSIGEDSGDDCRMVIAPNRQSLTPPPFKRRRRSKIASGEWVQRFVALQNAQNNDAVRLQNRAFSKVLLDLSDPRKRAKTSMDVTILGQYIGPWINVADDKKLTVLGYAHRHTNQKTRVEKNRHSQKRTLTQDEVNTVSRGFFAWFTFTLSTARRIELQQGCKLRIYNPIVLPCRAPFKLDAPPKSMFAAEEDKMENHDTVCCDKTVICTQLCEKLASYE